ncbi:MAG: hypothetical protein GXY61_06970 [Lentisphaerae bacterium]|jgi:hypothetical protein|nr:hypothetical protein [Lentisphaerota bacterium]
MNNFEAMIITAIGSLVVRVIVLFAIPTLLILAAKKLWYTCPRWIPCVIGGTAIIRFLTSIPPLLMHPLVQQSFGRISMDQYSKIAVAIAIINWPIAIAFPVAVLALAIQMKRKTDWDRTPHR